MNLHPFSTDSTSSSSTTCAFASFLNIPAYPVLESFDPQSILEWQRLLDDFTLTHPEYLPPFHKLITPTVQKRIFRKTNTSRLPETKSLLYTAISNSFRPTSLEEIMPLLQHHFRPASDHDVRTELCDHLAHFERIFNFLDIPTDRRVRTVLQSLTGRLRERLEAAIGIGPKPSWDQFLDLCDAQADALHRYHLEHAAVSRTLLPRRSIATQPQSRPHLVVKSTPPRSAPSPVPSTPQTPSTRSPLTTEERDRCLREHLCYYCRQPGHSLNECPARRVRDPVATPSSSRGSILPTPTPQSAASSPASARGGPGGPSGLRRSDRPRAAPERFTPTTYSAAALLGPDSDLVPVYLRDDSMLPAQVDTGAAVSFTSARQAASLGQVIQCAPISLRLADGRIETTSAFTHAWFSLNPDAPRTQHRVYVFGSSDVLTLGTPSLCDYLLEVSPGGQVVPRYHPRADLATEQFARHCMPLSTNHADGTDLPVRTVADTDPADTDSADSDSDADPADTDPADPIDSDSDTVDSASVSVSPASDATPSRAPPRARSRGTARMGPTALRSAQSARSATVPATRTAGPAPPRRAQSTRSTPRRAPDRTDPLVPVKAFPYADDTLLVGESQSPPANLLDALTSACVDNGLTPNVFSVRSEQIRLDDLTPLPPSRPPDDC
eukprot:gnl/Trimastix_PCT/524.p1 GENE.gnl/Trimastix_PCT/524~~gnl/Trimastix_PCT/524.p1  ORF type:complete len:677 (+),score=44.66 gnl/Trimastix_PCT/524:31-2031(+)